MLHLQPISRNFFTFLEDGFHNVEQFICFLVFPTSTVLGSPEGDGCVLPNPMVISQLSSYWMAWRLFYGLLLFLCLVSGITASPGFYSLYCQIFLHLLCCLLCLFPNSICWQTSVFSPSVPFFIYTHTQVGCI